MCVCRCVSVFNAKWRVEFVVAFLLLFFVAASEICWGSQVLRHIISVKMVKMICNQFYSYILDEQNNEEGYSQGTNKMEVLN